MNCFLGLKAHPRLGKITNASYQDCYFFPFFIRIGTFILIEREPGVAIGIFRILNLASYLDLDRDFLGDRDLDRLRLLDADLIN